MYGGSTISNIIAGDQNINTIKNLLNARIAHQRPGQLYTDNIIPYNPQIGLSSTRRNRQRGGSSTNYNQRAVRDRFGAYYYNPL
jgi:hypothetical protein